ncbi:MAG: efflux RND transporter periplasmic adaptor subunit [Thermoanaerobaculaceae bacterium]|jgi:HlyD family secretion protein|nr:efflux RND transporter periplasmic adaptor subunit [Thermoanaerobaculaceae bacterium]
MRSRARWLIVAGGVALTAVALRLTVLRPEVVQVEVARVEAGVVEESVTNSRAGTVKARRRARLSPQTGGVVAELPFRRGDRVPAGAVVLRLDASVQQAQLTLAREDTRTARAHADEACLAAELAIRELGRGTALQADGIASEQHLDTLASSRDQTAAACRAARAAVDQSAARVRVVEAELALSEVRAPFGGVLAEVSTEVGEWLTPAPPGVPIPPVLDLIDPTSIYVSAPIDEVESERLQLGQEAGVTVDTRPGLRLPGRVARVAPFVLDALEQNRTVEIEVELTDPGATAGLLPGLSADVEVIIDRRDRVLRLPTSAIAEGGKVLLLDRGWLAERVVVAGMRNWLFTEVRDGLRDGDLVVTSRTSTDIKPGVRAEARGGR